MDSIQSTCQLACSGYADRSSSCSQIPGSYGRYPNSVSGSVPGMSMRGNTLGQTNGPSMISGRMPANVATGRADHMQSSMFQTSIGLQSKIEINFKKFKKQINLIGKQFQ